MRQADHATALRCYIHVLQNRPELGSSIAINVKHAWTQFHKARVLKALPSIAVIGGQDAGASVERIKALTAAYASQQIPVDIVNGPDIESAASPQPIAGGAHARKFPITGKDFDKSALVAFASEKAYSLVHLCNPGLTEVMLGLLCKVFWNSRVLVDLSGEAGSSTTLPALAENLDGITMLDLTKASEYAGEVFAVAPPNLLEHISPSASAPLPDKDHIKPMARRALQAFGGAPAQILNTCLRVASEVDHATTVDLVGQICADEIRWLDSLGLRFLDTRTTAEQLFWQGSLGTYFRQLYKVAVGRSAEAHEFGYYGNQLKSGEASRLQIAQIVFGCDECRRYVEDHYSPRNPHVARKTFKFPKPGEIDPGTISLPYFDEPLVSVLIPVYKKVEYTLNCLRSIAQHLPAVPFEIVVLDDNSPDDSVAELQKVQNLRVVVHPENLGFLRSCNRGAQLSRGKYLFFLNNDTEVLPGWLDELLDTYQYFPKAGLVGSKLVYPDGALQEAGGIIWADSHAWNFGRDSDPNLPAYNYTREVDYCSGAAILVSKALFDQVGQFDERYVPAYSEDSSLAFEVRKAGWQVVYQPRSVVVHFEGVSNGTNTASGIKAYQVENQKKFQELWRKELETDHFPNGEHVFLARDRAGHKRIVLVVDHYIPQPDRDAGSRTMWAVLVALREQGYVVKFWPENLHRDPQYAPALEKLGIEVIWGREYHNGFERWMRENGNYLDGIFLSRPHVAVPLLPYIRDNTRAKIVYYGHDIHFLRVQAQLALRFDEAANQAMEQVRELELKMWRSVDTVLYPSDDETAYVKQWMLENKVNAIARTLPPYAFDPQETNPAANLMQRQGILFVAGFGHPPNAEAALWFVRDIFPLVRKHFPDLHVYLVGSNPTQAVKELAGRNVTVTGYVSDDELADYYHRVRVAVVPLQYGGGIKGKVVESMHFGLPCVTTSTGVQGLHHTEKFLPPFDDAARFAREVISLLRDDKLWKRRSTMARAYVAGRFSRQALAKVLTDELPAQPYATLQERFGR